MSRNFADSNNKIIEMKTLLGVPLFQDGGSASVAANQIWRCSRSFDRPNRHALTKRKLDIFMGVALRNAGVTGSAGIHSSQFIATRSGDYMLLCIPEVLKGNDLQNVRDELATVTFVDGKETAHGLAKVVKNNLQASATDPKLESLRRFVFEKILSHELVQWTARPKTISMLMFSKYHPGMAYGSHVDNPYKQGMRSDVSFTLFLSDPESYDGGELVIESPSGDRPLKLPAGGVVVYPATTLHRVNAITRGERLAAVGWIRSIIRDASQREVLFDLETIRLGLRTRSNTEKERMLIGKTLANLVRMWGDD